MALIHRMARENRTWGAKRIRGELLKLGLRGAKSTIQLLYQTGAWPWFISADLENLPWAAEGSTCACATGAGRTGIHNHASEIWAGDILFRALFLFVIIELDTRRIVHFRVTHHPADSWLAQQLPEATLFDSGPHFLIRDNDRKFGASFSPVAFGTGIDVLRTPYRAPKANAICERFLGSLQRSLRHSE